MGSPYAPVTHRHEPLPEGTRVTAYWFASHHGLPVSYGFLLEFGARAARAARWYGIERSVVWEGAGPPGTEPGFWVLRWTEDIWMEAAAGLVVPCSPSPPPPPPVPQTRTTVVNIARDPYQVYIGRPGPWGNPFVIGRDGTRNGVIARYSAWVRAQPALMARLGELRGMTLGCHCKPEPCHGDVLAALADGRPPPPLPPQRQPQSPPGPSGKPRWTAWQYAEKTQMLTGEGDPAFVAELDSAAAYVAAKRGVAWEPHWTGGVVFSAWPESLWRDVAGAMAQIGAERGETELGEDELDAVADGYLPDPGYRPGGKPTAAQFMTPGYDDGSYGNGFWSCPPPPEDTQAYVDWTAMADEQGRGHSPGRQP